MKKYIALAYFLGFLTCVGCVYGFGAYTTYRIHEMEAANSEQNKNLQQLWQHRMNFRNPPSALSAPINPATQK